MAPFTYASDRARNIVQVVVWSGDGQGASGTRYLCAKEEPVTRHAEPSLPSQPPSIRITEALKSGPGTYRQLARRIDMPLSQANSTLWLMEQRGQVDVIGRDPKVYQLKAQAL